MNANPSGTRTRSAGGRGGSKARRVCVVAVGPLAGRKRAVGRVGESGCAHRRLRGSIGGTRHAMRVCRGAPSARRAAQGRVGDQGLRHVIVHLENHLFLMAKTSAPADAIRSRFDGVVLSRRPAESTDQLPSSRLKAQRTGGFSSRSETSDGTELVRSAPGAVEASRCRLSRGKGVLAV